MKRPRISIRLDENQNLVLNELSVAMNVPVSILVRTIILDFLTRNNDVLERIATGEVKIDYRELIGDNNIEYDD